MAFLSGLAYARFPRVQISIRHCTPNLVAPSKDEPSKCPRRQALELSQSSCEASAFEDWHKWPTLLLQIPNLACSPCSIRAMPFEDLVKCGDGAIINGAARCSTIQHTSLRGSSAAVLAGGGQYLQFEGHEYGKPRFSSMVCGAARKKRRAQSLCHAFALSIARHF